MKNLTTLKNAINLLEKRNDRSTWDRATTADAIDLIGELIENINGGYMDNLNIADFDSLKNAMLNGARDWQQWSEGGCGLVYDYDIAKHYCTPSELKRSNNGDRNPNRQESWIDLQARAINQGFRKAYRAIKESA